MIAFPNINPTAFSIFGIDIQWYGLAYATGLFLGLVYAKYIVKNKNTVKANVLDDFYFG